MKNKLSAVKYNFRMFGERMHIRSLSLSSLRPEMSTMKLSQFLLPSTLSFSSMKFYNPLKYKVKGYMEEQDSALTRVKMHFMVHYVDVQQFRRWSFLWITTNAVKLVYPDSQLAIIVYWKFNEQRNKEQKKCRWNAFSWFLIISIALIHCAILTSIEILFNRNQKV